MDETTFDRLINIQTYSDDELKSLAQQLSDDEREVSKRRRLLHGEIDIVRAEMVRRLRDKHGAGQGVFKDGDISALTAILTGKPLPGAEASAAAASAPVQKATPAPPTATAPAQRAIQERFRDLSVNVREERLLRYISKQLGEGRHLDDILADEYILTHTNETKREQLLLNPNVLRALQDEMRQEFADYDSATRPKTDSSQPE